MAERPVETAKQDQMTKTFTVLALLGLALAAGAAFFGLPGSSILQAQEEQRADVGGDAAASCRMVEVALDEGYGVTRRAVRTDCSAVQ
ncbi:MAG: hypothetical protein WB663_08735 [Beijerinckiaceae bacterium]